MIAYYLAKFMMYVCAGLVIVCGAYLIGSWFVDVWHDPIILVIIIGLAIVGRIFIGKYK